MSLDAKPLRMYDEPVPVDPEALRLVMRTWATGVTVVAAELNSVCHGMTVSSFTSVSLDPPLVLVSLETARANAPLAGAVRLFCCDGARRGAASRLRPLCRQANRWRGAFRRAGHLHPGLGSANDQRWAFLLRLPRGLNLSGGHAYRLYRRSAGGARRGSCPRHCCITTGTTTSCVELTRHKKWVIGIYRDPLIRVVPRQLPKSLIIIRVTQFKGKLGVFGRAKPAQTRPSPPTA